MAGKSKNSKKAVDEVAVFRSDEASALREALGELSLIAPGDEPEIVGGFRLDSIDGERWAEALAEIEWLFEEADGAAIGRLRDGTGAFVFVDNEGQFKIQRTLVDHFAWKDHDLSQRSALEALAKKHGFAPPLSARERVSAVADIPTPDERVRRARVEDEQRAGRDTVKSGAKKSAKKAAGAAPSSEPSPRPMCRMIQRSWAADGTLYTLSGEDFGAAYGEPLTRGATFRFDEARSCFVRLEKMPPGKYGMLDAAPWQSFAFSPESCLDGERWRSRSTVTIPPDVDGFSAHRLGDGTWAVIAPRARAAYRFRRGETALDHVASLPFARSDEQLIELADGRWLLAMGQENYRTVLHTTLVDPRAGTAIEGPDLPGAHGTLVASKGRAVLLHGYMDEPSMPATISVFDGEQWTPHAPPPGLFDKKFGMQFAPLCSLRDGRVLMHAWRSMAIALLDVDAMTLEPAGTMLLNHGTRGVELRDGRVLIVGGTLYNNLDAEPELWDPNTRSTSVLPGRDKELKRQRRELEKYREKQRAKGYL